MALCVALIRPLPSVAGDTVAAAKKQTRKHMTSASARRRHVIAKRRADHKRRAEIVKYARRFLGVPYQWGGSSPRYGFDCSGLTRYVFDHFRISLPHSSYGDMQRGRTILRKYLMPGDLVFFNGGGHVGIYIGRNRLIEALHSGTVVHITTMTGWYSSSYSGARRILPS
jgi:cell wall-associated NlpC family hydrolase